jgi:hypothetical protein
LQPVLEYFSNNIGVHPGLTRSSSDFESLNNDIDSARYDVYSFNEYLIIFILSFLIVIAFILINKLTIIQELTKSVVCDLLFQKLMISTVLDDYQ